MFARFLISSALVTMAAGATIAGAAVAGAAPATLRVSPTSVPAGSSVRVSGTCEANTTGFAISPAFLHDATHDFAGVGAASFSTNAAGSFSTTAQIPASTAPGSYTVTARCGGGNLGVQATLVVTTAGGPPTAVPAGSGGHAVVNTSTAGTSELLFGTVGALLLLGGVTGAVRQRRSARR